MEIETRSKFLHRHYRALQMPAWASRANRCFPRSLPRLRRFPQREIARAVLLIFVDIHRRAVFHAGEIFFRELAVLRKLCDPKVIGTILGSVSNIFRL